MQIKRQLKIFCDQYHDLDFEKIIDYFSLFGGVTTNINLEIDFFDFVINDVIPNLLIFEKYIQPSYILESPYRELLIAIAKGDGKLFGAVKKARINETLGEQLVMQLKELGIVFLEESREMSFSLSHYKNYRTQSKIRFKIPFYRFWFGFIEPFRSEIIEGEYGNVVNNFKTHYERLRSLIYEQLSNEMLFEIFTIKGKEILLSGSYWDRNNEFDIVANTKNGEIIMAECKYKDRKVCKNELGKLKFKAEQSNINVSHWVLFSKDGFSNELLHHKESNLTIFDLKDMKKWILG